MRLEELLLEGKKLLDVPSQRQQTNYTCGPAALRAVIKALGLNVSEKLLALHLNTKSREGTSPVNLSALAKKLGLKFYDRTNMSLFELRKLTDAGHPVLVVLQAWKDKTNSKRWIKDWADGHYVIVTGVKEGKVYLSDPSLPKDQAHDGYIPEKEFMTRWHDKESDGTKYFQWGLVFNARIPKKTVGTIKKVR